MQNINVQKQFGLRADTFDQSARWINENTLISAHVKIAGDKGNRRNGLELCCGTGIVGKSFVENGWNMIGVDLTKEMVIRANHYFPAFQGNVESLCFEMNTFDLVVMRQALFLVDIEKALQEIKRVLKEEGIFILSQTVPFSNEDEEWLKKIHYYKQEQMLRFYNDEDLEQELANHGFTIIQKEYVRIRESITKWMEYAPEQNEEKKNNICRLILEAPDGYRKVRNVQAENGELYEDWNWVIFKAIKK